ncbi:MAG: hypothetical protein ACRD2N_24340 [Vicinamibacterales bacterium]
MAKSLRRPVALASVASPSVHLARFIAKFMPAMQAMTKSVLRKMRLHFPGATEMVYDNYQALVIGFCPNDHASDVICSIAVYPRWINLYFFEGDTLPDPEGLLQGNGNLVRRIVLQHTDDLDRPAVQALIQRAIDRADPPLNLGAKRRLLIKAISAKQRPRRPKHTQGGDFSPRRAVKRASRPRIAIADD